MNELTLIIDGEKVSAQKGETVLAAAKRAQIDIPTLCAHPGLDPFGACRLCIVKIEGLKGYPTSCTTPAVDGMKVETRTEEIIKLRQSVIKLMMSGHTSPCIVCLHKELCEKYRPQPTKAGRTTRCGTCSNRADCFLRNLCEEYNIKDFDVPIIYNDVPVERSDPFMDRDYSLCVLCGRCVRICESIHGQAAIGFIGRGKDTRIGTVLGRDHIDTNCKFCGSCIDICPTGSLTDRYSKWRGLENKIATTTCMLCPIGCRINLKLKDDKVIGAEATTFTKEASICAVGRFVLPQLFENPSRLKSHTIRLEDGVRKVSYEDALAHAVEKLKKHIGPAFALIAHPSTTREEIHIMEKFTKDVMLSPHFAMAMPSEDGTIISPEAVRKGIEEGTIKALFTTGDYLDRELLKKLDVLIVADVFPSGAFETADALIAAAVLAETEGIFVTANGELRTLEPLARAPQDIHPDWKIICDIAKKMSANGFDCTSAKDMTKEVKDIKPTKQPSCRSPLDDAFVLPRMYRGHALSDVVCGLKSISLKKTPRPEKPKDQTTPQKTQGDQPFRIVKKVELVPDTHMITVHAPVVAKNCKAGQFVIAMVNETSERIPYTIADWDKEEGTVTINILEAGRSSREMALLQEGDFIKHFAGPLGKEVEVKKYGTVLCGGGCYGVGAMLPIARAMKEAGNKVICVNEASSHYLLYWQEDMTRYCDEQLIVTKDGSRGMKGGVQEVIASLVERGEKIDQAFIIGCTFMMMLVCDETKKHQIPTLTAMNPVMLDGTGMCGACRITMGEETKFACIDGPFLDGHQINWIELLQRKSAFSSEEVQSLPQDHRRCDEH